MVWVGSEKASRPGSGKHAIVPGSRLYPHSLLTHRRISRSPHIDLSPVGVLNFASIRTLVSPHSPASKSESSKFNFRYGPFCSFWTMLSLNILLDAIHKLRQKGWSGHLGKPRWHVTQIPLFTGTGQSEGLWHFQRELHRKPLVERKTTLFWVRWCLVKTSPNDSSFHRPCQLNGADLCSAKSARSVGLSGLLECGLLHYTEETPNQEKLHFVVPSASEFVQHRLSNSTISIWVQINQSSILNLK